MLRLVCPSSLAVFALAAAMPAQLSTVGQFASGLSPVGCAYDPASDTVWVYPAFGTELHRFSAAGTPLGTIARPGGSANDADVEVAPVALSLGGTPVPAGALLFVDGESGVAEIWAVDASSGAVLGSLVTQFGVDHVVGGAYHPQRGTFFLVQDRVPAGSAVDNLVGEIDAATGAVLGTFQTTTARPSFTVNYGDLDVTANGNLLIVSSDESEIGEFTPAGAWVAGHALPAGVDNLAGIGIDATGCELWVAESGGAVVELRATCPGVAAAGAGCPSSGGGNVLTATQLPWLGSDFVATATGLPAVSVTLAVTSFSPQVPPLPLSALLPQGQPGCVLHVQPDVLMFLPASGGQATHSIFFAASPAFVGVQFYEQMLVAELGGAGIAALTSTNALRLTIGSY